VILKKERLQQELPFEIRAFGALGISIVADALDYVGTPIFSMPIIGDIADGIIMSFLYSLTKSKRSTAINLIEFVPFIGDLVPTYTISTLLWIRRELKKKNKGTQIQAQNVQSGEFSYRIKNFLESRVAIRKIFD
jgi:hypothetical protein